MKPNRVSTIAQFLAIAAGLGIVGGAGGAAAGLKLHKSPRYTPQDVVAYQERARAFAGELERHGLTVDRERIGNLDRMDGGNILIEQARGRTGRERTLADLRTFLLERSDTLPPQMVKKAERLVNEYKRIAPQLNAHRAQHGPRIRTGALFGAAVGVPVGIGLAAGIRRHQNRKKTPLRKK
jgi:hypothetical protein